MNHETFRNKDIKNLSYVGYALGFLGGNFLAPTAGITTKIIQDNNTSRSKTIDYIRAGAFVYTTIDCLLGSPILSNNSNFIETGADIVTMASLAIDMANYSFSKNPLKETYNDAKTSIKRLFE